MNQRGFTFTEILIVLGVLLLFSTFFVVVVNPIHRIQEARDDTREVHLNTILLGIEQKLSREGGWNCASLPTDRFREIGTGPGMYDLYSCLTPNYLSKYLVDPKEGNPSSGRDVTDGLVGHWKFDEGSGTIAYDASGNSNHGTLVNNPSWVDGKMGGALDFDGSSNYVDCGNDESLNITNAITVEAWVKPVSSNHTGYEIVSKKTYWQDPNGYGFMIYPTDAQFYWGDGTGYGGGSISTLIPYDNGWYHIVGTVEDKVFKLYVNGDYKGSCTSAISFSAGNSNNLYISKEGNYWFNGLIDDVRIYNRALSPEEIQDLYNYEYSSKYAIWQNPVTKNISLKSLESETKEVSTGAPEVALDFDGSGDYVDCGNDESLNITDAITIGAWIKRTGTGGNYQHIVSKFRSSQAWLLGLYQGYEFIIVNESGVRKDLRPGGITVTNGAWYHYVGTYDGFIMKGYINGIDIGSSMIQSGKIKTTSSLLNLGGNPNLPSDFFKGQISDVRIYDRALSAEEVEQLYKGYDIRNGLVGHWPLNEGQGTTAYDRSGNGNDGTLIGGPTWTTK